MAMSTLAAQLAGLNSAGKKNQTVGSVLPASTRHEDAIGRGFHHSVQVGHSVPGRLDPRMAPSLLYSDAKAASDISVAILWENCELALTELASSYYPSLQNYVGICQDSLLRQKRKTSSTNNLSLTHLLTILSTLLPHDVTNCGHVLEYLVRRYNIHVAAADTLLMMLLPHCDTPSLKSLFHRALELVNIMGAIQTQHTWIWLRPYAQPLPNDGSAIKVPPRHVVAQQVVAPHTALLQQVCNFTQSISRLEGTHRGKAQILSWSATVVVQGLHHLQTRQTLPQTQESVLRVLLPVCTKACSSFSDDRDWTVWGHVVASVIAETMELAPAVQQLMCQSIVAGAVKAITDNSNEDDDQDTKIMVGDALVAVASVCFPLNTTIPDPWNATLKTWKDCVLLPFPTVLETILNGKMGDMLPDVLEHLLVERKLERMGIVLVLPLLIWAVLHPAVAVSEERLVALLRNPAVRQFVWKQHTECLAEWLVWVYVQDMEEDDEEDNDKSNNQKEKQGVLVQTLLKELRRMDAKACEQGMAHALQEVAVDSDCQSTLKVLLDSVLPPATNTKDSNSDKASSTSSWLPPRVALEHSEPSLRLQAIEQLLQEYVAGSDDMDVDKDDNDNGEDDDATESLQTALGRRLASDDNPNVVLAAAKALQTILAKNNKTSDKQISNAEDNALRALYQWTSFQKPEAPIEDTPPKKKNSPNKKKKGQKKDEVAPERAADETQQSIIIHCLQLLGTSSDSSPSSLVLEAVVAHLEHWNEKVVTEATSAIIRVLGEEEKSTTDAKRLLLLERHEFCASLLLEQSETRTGRDEMAQQSLRRRSLWVLLDAMKEYVSDPRTSVVVTEVSQMAADACLFLLSSKTEKNTWDSDKGRAQKVLNAWKACISHIATTEVARLLVSLASLPDSNTYRDLLITELANKVKDTSGNSVSVFSVLLEAALQETASPKAIKQLLRAAESELQDTDSTLALCVVPALALLEHADKAVRDQSLELLTALSRHIGTTKKSKAVAAICQEVLKKRSSAALGGISFLPLSFAEAVRKSGDALRDCLLSLCFCSAVACGDDSVTDAEKMVNKAWLPFGRATGHIGAVATILHAMELAGEKAFPLNLRWDRFGAPMLKLLLAGNADNKDEISASGLVLCDSVVSMMKGIAVADTRSLDTVVISSGPGSSGRRQRSYSVGKADGVTFVDPYPAGMVAAILDVLVTARKGKTTAARTLCEMLASKVLGRESWATSVFQKIATEDKRKIAAEILSILAEAELQITVDFFLGLPLDAADVTVLQSGFAMSQDGLSAMSLLADYIRANRDQLTATPHATKLITTLFESLGSLSSAGQVAGGDGVEFVRQVTLSALVDLFSSSATAGRSLKIADKKVKEFVDLLLSLNANDAAPGDVRPLVSQRSKAVSLTLLMSLCSSFPKPVVSSLIPAMTTQIEAVQNIEDNERVGEGLYSSFVSIVPVFWEYSSHAGLSFSDLLCAFVVTARSISNHERKAIVYASFLRSIVESSLSGQSESSVGAIVASYFAGEKPEDAEKFKEDLQASTAFALQLIEEAPAVSQVSSMALLLHYADSLLVMLQPEEHSEATSSSTSFDGTKSQLPKANEILNMALFGSKSAPNKGHSKKSPSKKKTSKMERGTIMNLVQAILLTLNDAMLLDSVRKFIRRSERSNTALCLQLWQDMLIVQSTVSGTASSLSDGDDDDYWESLIRVTGETLEHIQALMPLPIFLASATSLIKDGGTDDLRAGAIRLVADRAPEVRPGSPEASLFLEMASLLVEFLTPQEKPSNEANTGQFQLQQAALVAIEHIARAVVGNDAARGKKRPSSSAGTQTFLSALQGCADLFVQICGPGKDQNVDIGQLDDEPRKLLSSAALCTATLVRVTAPKCLALLPKFMNQLVSCLTSVNQFMSSIGNDQQESLSEARMLQVCILRALAAVAESVPQFIYPYLKQLLASSALPSEMLRKTDADQTVLHAADGLEKCLSKQVPARVLLPVISSSMSNLKAPVEFEVLLRMLKESVDSSSGEELAGHLGSLLKAVTATYDFDCELSYRYALIDVANEAVLALVMKLSENHLRRLFASLRDWKGSLNLGNPEELALRRVAFWKVSAVLSKELRMIFLPCLSSVLPDLLEELNLFVSQFSSPKKSEKSKDGTKKRRLEDDSTAPFSTDAMLPLQPLLTCVEFALRADAADGGKWIRAGDDGERYRSVLAPLGKLLQAKLPDNFPLSVSDNLVSPFQEVIQGGDDAMGGSSTSSSSVVGCLTALASAAGNEQLWKPLNYAILDACGSRGRSEVRKAGLLCLLSVMKSLGEEYMVLLPECLPVLSELLEDNDEEVAGLAQDCISLGEDLLGESLEDNLR